MGISKLKISALSVAAFFGVSTTSLAEELITADDSSRILNLAKGYGNAVLKTDGDGDPLITGRVDGNKYGIFFYGCNKGKDCDDILFAAAWSGVNASISDVNNWNRKKRYGVAYIDKDGDPVLNMVVNLDYGVSSRNLDDTFGWWVKAMSGFKKDVLKR